MGQQWWRSFFDEDYFRLWGAFVTDEQSDREAEGLRDMLDLRAGARVLDAPCGYGRLSRRLAEWGARVLGVDQSVVLLGRAEADRGAISVDRLRYLRHDLRKPLEESGFDAALNIFSSIGYGSEKDDLAIFRTLRRAVRPGGLVVVETNHRDAVAAFLSRNASPALRLPDGTLVVEEPRLDAVTGRVETCWHWSGPAGAGKKSASLRLYTASELVALMERAGLKFRSAFAGCTTRPFEASGETMGGRLAILAERRGR